MALVSSDVPSLANGVSQQPAALRLPSQNSVQENCIASLVEGLKKRPPREHVARLSATAFDPSYVHWIDRDSAERYEVIITNGDLRVYDSAGNAKTVSFPDGKAYLNCIDPSTDFHALSIVDYTFIVNRTKTVAKTAPVSPPQPSSTGLIFIRQAAYAVTYKVFVDGAVQASHTVPTSSGADTETIATALVANLTTNIGANYTITQYGSVIKLTRINGASFALQGKDTAGDSYMYAFTDKTQRFEYLPAKGFDNYTIEVSGDPTNGFDSYYVTYDKPNNIWKESVKPQEADSLDASTMPYILVREISGDFTFKKAPWAARTAGDRDSSPDPSFVGQKISTVYFFRGRLCFLSDDNVLQSAVGEDGFFRFFRTTVRQILDSDPIDVAATASGVTILKAAVAYDEKLILFSANSQQILEADGKVTQETISIKPGTDYGCNLRAYPIVIGKTVVYATSNGSFAGISELYVDPDTTKVDTAEITSHVPAYIPGNITKFVPSTRDNIMFTLTDTVRSTLYVYSWHWSGNEKVQSCWGKFPFPETDTIVSANVFDNYLYIVLTRAEGTFLERIDLEDFAQDAGIGYKIRLDRRSTLTGVYDAGNNWTTWTLPAPIPVSVELAVVLGQTFTGRIGDALSSVTRPSTTTVRTPGNFSSGVSYIGTRYRSIFELSQIVLGQESGRGRKPVLGGSLHIKSVTFNHAQTAAYEVHITPRNGETYVAQFVSRAIGDASAVLGKTVLADGEFRTRPLGRADAIKIEVISDSHQPFSILGYSYQANYVTQAQRV